MSCPAPSHCFQRTVLCSFLPHRMPYLRNNLGPRLNHTPLLAVDWARGEHLTEAGPIRVLTPGDWRGWDRESDKALSWLRAGQVTSPLRRCWQPSSQPRQPERSERYFCREEVLMRQMQEMRNRQRAWFLFCRAVAAPLPWGSLKQSPFFA